VLARELDGMTDLLAGPIRDADEARLARVHDLGQRVERLLERDVVVVGVALVEVDVVELQPTKRVVDLLQDLRAREAAVAVRHLAHHLGRHHERFAQPSFQRPSENLLRSSLAVDVRGVEEVDAALERDVEESTRCLLVEGASERRPRPETDLRDPEVAVAERPEFHYGSVSIWARCSRPE
jgi:hypothetical protein